jgi:hypothetical protein
LNFSNDPFFLALFCKDPAKTCIIRPSPECKVEEEEYARYTSWQDEKNNNLEGESAKVEDIEMRFGMLRVEQ